MGRSRFLSIGRSTWVQNAALQNITFCPNIQSWARDNTTQQRVRTLGKCKKRKLLTPRCQNEVDKTNLGLKTLTVVETVVANAQLCKNTIGFPNIFLMGNTSVSVVNVHYLFSIIPLAARQVSVNA